MSFQVMRAADHMGVSYLLVVCCQLAIMTYHVPCTVTMRAMCYNQILSTTTMEHLLVEHGMYKNWQLKRKAMSSVEGRKALDELQHLRREAAFSGDLSTDSRRRSRISHNPRALHDSARSARIGASWEKENGLLQRTLECASDPGISLAEALGSPAAEKLSVDTDSDYLWVEGPGKTDAT